MKFWTLIGTAIGIALTFWLLSKYGVARILDLVVAAGWAIPVVAFFHLTQIISSALAWRLVVEGFRRESIGFFCVLRWIREGVNNLLPVAQFGGVVVTTRLLVKRGVALPQATAGGTVDTTLEFITHIVFTLMGVGILLVSSVQHDIANYAIAGIVAAVALAAFLLGAQWFGLAKIVEWAASRLGEKWGWAEPNSAAGLHDAIISLYRSPRRIGGCFLFHLASWVLGAFEIYISLRALGYQTSFVNCLVIEALGQALRSAGFAVPGALGVQEGGYILAAGLYGVPPDMAIAVSLIKRLRDILLGLPALAVWNLLESRAQRNSQA